MDCENQCSNHQSNCPFIRSNALKTNKRVIAGINGFAAINHSKAKRMHGIVSFMNLAESISKSENMILTVKSVQVISDTILWVISDQIKVITKEVEANSIALTTAELIELRFTTIGIIQVADYTSESEILK